MSDVRRANACSALSFRRRSLDTESANIACRCCGLFAAAKFASRSDCLSLANVISCQCRLSRWPPSVEVVDMLVVVVAVVVVPALTPSRACG